MLPDAGFEAREVDFTCVFEDVLPGPAAEGRGISDEALAPTWAAERTFRTPAFEG